MKKPIAIIAFTLAVVACGAAAKREEAKDAYLAQELDCVKQFGTRPEIDACRDRVKNAWGLGSDAGKDGAQ